jgi:dienelactone hydrolase
MPGTEVRYQSDGLAMMSSLHRPARSGAAPGVHSGLQVTSPQDAGKIKGKVMALLGAEDPGIPADQREAFHRMLTDAGVDWQMSLYGGVAHSFANKDADKAGRPEFLRYDERADRRSWQEVAALMEEVFA